MFLCLVLVIIAFIIILVEERGWSVSICTILLYFAHGLYFSCSTLYRESVMKISFLHSEKLGFFKNGFFSIHEEGSFCSFFTKNAPLLSTFVVPPGTAVERSGATMLTAKKIFLSRALSRALRAGGWGI